MSNLDNLNDDFERHANQVLENKETLKKLLNLRQAIHKKLNNNLNSIEAQKIIDDFFSETCDLLTDEEYAKVFDISEKLHQSPWRISHH